MKAIFILFLALALSGYSQSQTWQLVQKHTFMPAHELNISLKQTGSQSLFTNHDLRQGNKYAFPLGSTSLSPEAIRQHLLSNGTSLANGAGNQGQDKLVAGKVLIGLGVPLTLLGIAGAIGYAIDGETAPLIVMCVATPVGVGILIGGIICVVSGKNETAQELKTNDTSKYMTSRQPKCTISYGITRSTPGVGINIAF